MASIPGLAIPGYTQQRDVDWAPLSDLGKVLGENRLNNQRREAMSLAALGTDGTPDYKKTINSLVGLGDFAGAGQVAAIQKAVAPESSADMQAYSLYTRQGGKLPYLDFKKQLVEAGSTRINNTTNVNNVGEREYDKALNKELADVFLGYQKAGRNAAGAINTLNYMEGLTKSPSFYSGAGGDLVTKGKQALSSMGISAPEAASPNEVFKALSNKLTLDAAGGSLGAQISNSDVAFLQAINPNLVSTPEGNRELIGYHRKVYQRQQEVARMAREYAKTHGGRIDAGFEQVVADYAEKNPLFTRSPNAPKVGSQPTFGDIDAEIKRRGLR
jgi:hypothetical protein